MKRDMRDLAPDLDPLPAQILEAITKDGKDLPRLLIGAAKILAAGAEVVHSERAAMSVVVEALRSPPVPFSTPLPHPNPPEQAYGPAFPTTQQVMDTLSAVSVKLVELENDVAQLKRGEFVEEYLKSLGVSPGALKAVGLFANTFGGSA